MASLLSWLAYDGARTSAGAAVASGKAWFFQPGTTSTQVAVFSDADGLYALTQPVTLDAGGRAVVYTDRVVQCEVQTAAGATVRLSDRANAVSAAQVEIQNTVATGTSLTTGSQVEGGRTDLNSFLTDLRDSLGAPDGEVDMAGTARPIKDAIRVLTHWFDVTVSPYGAAGDGVTDDTLAIQAAITAANASGGGVVFFPPGTYIVSSLTIPATISLQGCGNGKSILQTSSATEVLLVAEGAFTALALSFKTTGKGLLRFTTSVVNTTTFTACAFACTNAASTGVITGLVASGPFSGTVNLMAFSGCDFVQTGAGGTQAFCKDGCNLHGGTILFVSGKAFGGDFTTLTGVYIEYQGAVTGTLRTTGSVVQTLTGCTLVTTGVGALTYTGGFDLVETGTNLVEAGGLITRDAVMAYSQARESTQVAFDSNGTSYAPDPLTARRFFYKSSGASFQWANPTTASSFQGYDVELWYMNNTGGAITPTFGTMFKGTAVSVGAGNACGWLFTWNTLTGNFTQIGQTVAYTP
jgi:hypothetical protein